MTFNPESILDSVKKLIGLNSSDTSFDDDVTLFVNATFGSLRQLGVGSDTGFVIVNNTTVWSQYITNLALVGMIKSYIFMRVKLAFDPPATSFGIDAIKFQVQELEWRINSVAEQFDPPSDPFGGAVPQFIYVPQIVHLDPSDREIVMDASQGNVFYLTLTGSTTIDAPINGTDGQHITLELTSNGNAVTWGSGWNFGDNGTPSLSSDKTDIISAAYRTEVSEWYAGFSPGF